LQKKKRKQKTNYNLIVLIIFAATNIIIAQNKETTYNYLALGDSYTKGKGVCETCGFAQQLKEKIQERFSKKVKLNTVAETGWTTTNLINRLEYTTLAGNHDIVTLLIGVNNQYQDLSFSKFKREFPKLLDIAITAAQSKANKVIVLSIPDYAYTPSTYGADNQKKVTQEINKYNEYISLITNNKGVYYINITDITRLGIEDPTLVAADGLHPSAIAHKKFVEALWQKVYAILKE